MSPRINHTKSTNPAGFPFISTNVRCLFNKVEELRAIAEGSSAHHPVFIAVQETWADCADSDAMYDINNYNLYRADRKQNFGGGVCLYISATLQQSRLGIQLESAESVWMKITMGNYNVIVSSIYRPPRSDPNKFCEEIEQIIVDTKKQCDYLLILGDLNAKNSTWLSTDRTDALGENIHVLLEILGLKQYISFPTYLHRQLPKSCLDLVISNITHLETTSAAPLGASDHVVIQGKMYLDETSHHVPNSRTQSNRSVWRWDQKHVDALKAELRTTQLLTRPPPGDTSPVNTSWQHWRRTLLRLATEHCQKPPKHCKATSNVSPPKPWMTKDLLAEIKHKHKLYRSYLKCQSPTTWDTFTSQRNKVTHLLRIAKSDFVLASTNPAATFNKPNLHYLMKSIRKPTKSPIPELHTTTTTASSPAQKASLLNEYFIQQSRQSVENIPLELPSVTTDTVSTACLFDITTTASEVEILLKKLDIKKSPGHDSIPTRLLKELANEIAPSLAHIFNLSFQSGEIPQDWRDATITPIHKKGPKTSPTNYRPISLLSITSKVQERIVHDRLYKHISPHLPSQQSGFRKNDNTEFQLARVVHQLSEGRDAGNSVMACFFDLSKAFDRVWHAGLLLKLQHYGVTGSALAWFTSYLSNRRQRVQVCGVTCPWQTIPAGVPQGSVLGPLLFLVYTIDLPASCETEHTTCSQFADDTALIASTPTARECTEQLQQAVSLAGKWLSDWHLLVNTEKTVVMVFYNDNRVPNSLPTITLHGRKLRIVRQQRHLGVIIQHNLRWTAHIQYCTKKAISSMKTLYRVRNSLNKHALSYIYCTYIRPSLEYATIAVAHLPITTLDTLERLQRKAARICMRYPLFKPINHTILLHRLTLPTLFSRRKLKHVMLAHSLHYKYAPHHIASILPPTAPPVNYTLRQRHCYTLPVTRTDRHKESPILKSLSYLNLLPTSTLRIQSKDAFKKEVTALYLSSVCCCSQHPMPYS